MSTFLVLIIFAAWTWARCRAHLQHDFAGNGTAILHERANLTQGDSIANLAMVPVARDLSKRGILSQKRPQMQSYPSGPLPASASLEFHKTRDDFHWVAPITIGTSMSQELRIMIHTDFNYFWAKYTPHSSSEAADLGIRVKPETLPVPAGSVYLDHIQLGEISGKVRIIATQQHGLSNDGILGLRYSNHQEILEFTRFLSENAKPNSVFALYLATSGSRIHVGGPDPRYYQGQIEYHNLLPNLAHPASQRWQIGDGAIRVNGKYMATDMTTAFDSSTRFIYGPPSLVDGIYKSINKWAWGRAGFPKETFPCRLTPRIEFQWSRRAKWLLYPEHFNMGPIYDGSKMCRGVIKGRMSDTGWSLGGAFLMSVYTVYDLDQNNRRLGIAKLAEHPYLPCSNCGVQHVMV